MYFECRNDMEILIVIERNVYLMIITIIIERIEYEFDIFKWIIIIIDLYDIAAAIAAIYINYNNIKFMDIAAAIAAIYHYATLVVS